MKKVVVFLCICCWVMTVATGTVTASEVGVTGSEEYDETFEDLRNRERGNNMLEDGTAFYERYQRELLSIEMNNKFEKTHNLLRSVRIFIVVIGWVMFVLADLLLVFYFVDYYTNGHILSTITFGGMEVVHYGDPRLDMGLKYVKQEDSDRRTRLVTPLLIVVIFLVTLGVAGSCILGYVSTIIWYIGEFAKGLWNYLI